MPNRIIRDSCKTSPTLAALCAPTERCFWRLLTVADDFGRFHAAPEAIFAACFPLPSADICCQMTATYSTKELAQSWRDEMVRAGLILVYKVGEREFGVFTTWEKHQRLRATSSKFPEPICEGEKANILPKSLLNSGAATCGHLLSNAAGIGIGIGIGDGIGIELKPLPISTSNGHRPRKPKTRRNAYSDAFLTFWNAYPRKVGKGAAWKAWSHIKPDDALASTLTAAVLSQIHWPQWEKDNGEFIPHPATWLNQSRWEDEGKPYNPGDF